MSCENCEESAYVIDKLAKLLAEISVVVNGPEPPLTSWSYHDLPEKVRALLQAPPAAVPVTDAQFAAQVIGNWMINDTRRNPTAGPQCKTCKGFGMVGGSITPENFGYEDWPCPDCTDNTNTQN